MAICLRLRLPLRLPLFLFLFLLILQGFKFNRKNSDLEFRLNCKYELTVSPGVVERLNTVFLTDRNIIWHAKEKMQDWLVHPVMKEVNLKLPSCNFLLRIRDCVHTKEVSSRQEHLTSLRQNCCSSVACTCCIRKRICSKPLVFKKAKTTAEEEGRKSVLRVRLPKSHESSQDPAIWYFLVECSSKICSKIALFQ